MSETDLTASDLINVPQYSVCGVIIEASFDYSTLGKWKDYAKEKGLNQLEAKLSKAATGASQELRAKSAYDTQAKKVEALGKAVERKLKQLETDLDSWGDDDDEYLEKVSLKLDEARAKLDTMEADPEVILAAAEKHTEAIEKLQYDRRGICLEFVHGLAVDRGLTKDKLPVWQKKASGQDLTNAAEIIKKAVSLWSSSGRAVRHMTPKPKNQLN